MIKRNEEKFRRLEEASKAREEAEEKYYKPIIEKYKDKL